MSNGNSGVEEGIALNNNENNGAKKKRKAGLFSLPKTITQTIFNEISQVWKVGDYLGKGGYSEVYWLTKVTDEVTDEVTNEEDVIDNEKCANGREEVNGDKCNAHDVAGKFISVANLTKKKQKEFLENEIAIHKTLNHPNIVKFYGQFKTKEYQVLLMELCQNHSMFQLLRQRRRLSEYEVRYYLSEVIAGLSYLHSRNIVHHDIKLGNIYLDSNLHVKLGDFGFAEQLYDFSSNRILGTPNYVAPEVLDGCHNHMADIWSLGVVMYTCIIGKPPFETSDIKTTYQRIRSALYYFPTKIVASEEAKALIRLMLTINPETRICLSSILNHPFMVNHVIPDSLPLTALTMMPPEALLAPEALPSSDFVSEINNKIN